MTFFTSLLAYFRGKSLPKSHSMKSTPPPTDLSSKTLVVDVEGGLLRSYSTFPYFMLVALEGGGLLRGLLLLFVYPLVCLLSLEMGVRVMVFISFCGLKKERFVAGQAVLPKFFLEDVGLEGFEVLRKGKRRVCVSQMPRVMVEGFLKEYLEVEEVVGRELKVCNGFYTGFMEDEEDCKVEFKNGDCFIGVLSSTKSLHLQPFALCKELYLVSKSEKRKWHPLPREKYPRPIIFHDGRLAFRPGPLHTAAMFLWLPVGLPLALLRLTIGLSIPYKLSTPILASTAMKWRLKGSIPKYLLSCQPAACRRGQLLVCNHRTLIDPIYVAVALNRQVATVTYSVSRVTEVLSPLKMVRLTRNRAMDGAAMVKVLDQGNNLVVCPEGTTCREPYLLRFSPLFAELADEIVPVAINVRVSMFYATTAGGFKALDSFYYMMNPSMCYELEFLEKIDTSSVRVGKCSSIEMANLVQGVIGRALGFECTKLTRREKYMMLAGNNGLVASDEDNKSSDTAANVVVK